VLVFFITSIYNFTTAQKIDDTRLQWLYYLDKVAKPVLLNLAEDNLKNKMPVILSNSINNAKSAKKSAPLEAFARTLCGISPWLNLDCGTIEEINLRNQYRAWVLKGIANSVDSTKNDFMAWNERSSLVDGSFLALALIRSPWLWNNMTHDIRFKLITRLQSTRSIIPVYNNWILFSGMIEALFYKYNVSYDACRIEYGKREFSEHWYIGDGLFSDGMNFTMDYYNSYVIQPYLTNILGIINHNKTSNDWFIPKLEKISKRYAELQERSINTDGSFPVYGRSIVYRGAAFHHLADMALRKKLPGSIEPAQVRCALTAVIKKTLDAPNNFTNDGWLQIGLSGHQPDLADSYISTGSLYLCSVIFLPLGLPLDDPFWTAPEQKWTSQKLWNGINMPGDKSLKD
jgi:hypothetical protein